MRRARSSAAIAAGSFVIAAGCAPAAPARAPDPAIAPTTVPGNEMPRLDAALTLAEAARVIVVTRDERGLTLVEACTVPAVYAKGAVEYRLVSLATNAIPDAEACARGTHVVTKLGGDAIELVPMAPPRLVADATSITVAPRPRESWSIREEEQGRRICGLPCTVWMRPQSVHAVVRDDGLEPDKDRVLVFGPTVPEPDLHLRVGEGRDPLWPWLWIALGAVGAALTTTVIVLPATASGSSGSSGGVGKNAAALLAVGALALGLDVLAILGVAGGGKATTLVPDR